MHILLFGRACMNSACATVLRYFTISTNHKLRIQKCAGLGPTLADQSPRDSAAPCHLESEGALLKRVELALACSCSNLDFHMRAWIINITFSFCGNCW